jgi:prolipoprotein diacylglyceryltransferase
LICVGLFKADKRWRFQDGRLFAMYVASYTFIRFFVESLRIDEAKNFAGLRLNQWTSIVVFACALIYLVFVSNRSKSSVNEASSQDLLG